MVGDTILKFIAGGIAGLALGSGIWVLIKLFSTGHWIWGLALVFAIGAVVFIDD